MNRTVEESFCDYSTTWEIHGVPQIVGAGSSQVLASLVIHFLRVLRLCKFVKTKPLGRVKPGMCEMFLFCLCICMRTKMHKKKLMIPPLSPKKIYSDVPANHSGHGVLIQTKM